jgi:type IV secretory pathway VirB10-like protein
VEAGRRHHPKEADNTVLVLASSPGHATDTQGTSGLSGDTDLHRGSLYTTAILLTVLAGVEAGLSGGSQQ